MWTSEHSTYALASTYVTYRSGSGSFRSKLIELVISYLGIYLRNGQTKVRLLS